MTEYTQQFIELYKKKAAIHKFSPHKQILDIIKNEPPRIEHIIDIGCGDGSLTRQLAETYNVTGIDKSKEWIDYCNQQRKIFDFYIKTTASNLSMFPSYKIDIVVMNMVIPNITTEIELEQILVEIYRVMKRNGLLIISDMHPICKMTKKIRNRRQAHPHDFSYFKDGSNYSSSYIIDNKKLRFTNTHWSLEKLSFLLRQNNMHIERIDEPTYHTDAPYNLQNYPIPEYILLSCRKNV